MGSQLVANASSTIVDKAELDQTKKFAASLHRDAVPADAWSATEVEQPETDAALDALPFRLTTRVAPIASYARPSDRVVCASGWRAHSISSVVMAQGPP
jgi:hypothetical protein